jgi:hypothetical protein
VQHLAELLVLRRRDLPPPGITDKHQSSLIPGRSLMCSSQSSSCSAAVICRRQASLLRARRH